MSDRKAFRVVTAVPIKSSDEGKDAPALALKLLFTPHLWVALVNNELQA